MIISTGLEIMIQLKNRVLYYPSNENGKDFIVGDIHGCYEQFMKFKELIGFDNTKDIMYSVGDLIDRGRDSMSSFQLFYMPWFRPVFANHEDMMLDIVVNLNFSTSSGYFYNGGGWIEFVEAEELRAYSKDYIERVPNFIVVGEGENRFNIVHAEFSNGFFECGDEDIDKFYLDGNHLNNKVLLNTIWGRNIVKYRNTPSVVKSDVKLSKTFCGHTVLDSPKRVNNHYFIDTGAVFSERDMPRDMTIVDYTSKIVYSYAMEYGTVTSKPFDEAFM
jgi:serine/threonine protein phosphatase 1